MTAYTHTTSSRNHWETKHNFQDQNWSETPSLSYSFSTTTNSRSDYLDLEDLPLQEHHYHNRKSKMEDTWRNTPLPESPCTDMGSIAPYGLSGHRRGPSELESTMWDTAQVNGELGLAPAMSFDAKAAMGITPISTTATDKASNRIPGGVLPLPIAVWAKIMDTSKGRDKVLVSYHLECLVEVIDSWVEMRTIYFKDIFVSPFDYRCCSTTCSLVTV